MRSWVRRRFKLKQCSARVQGVDGGYGVDRVDDVDGVDQLGDVDISGHNSIEWSTRPLRPFRPPRPIRPLHPIRPHRPLLGLYSLKTPNPGG